MSKVNIDITTYKHNEENEVNMVPSGGGSVEAYDAIIRITERKNSAITLEPGTCDRLIDMMENGGIPKVGVSYIFSDEGEITGETALARVGYGMVPGDWKNLYVKVVLGENEYSFAFIDDKCHDAFYMENVHVYEGRTVYNFPD